jgi:hypothetical protein
MRSFDLTADLERRTEQLVQRVVPGAFRGILDRHHAEVGEPASTS